MKSEVEDRALGALLGLAVGDVIGTTLEFQPRDSYEPLTDMIGGGPFRLEPGQWTDDTAMALALAESLIACGGLDERDLMERFSAWRRRGDYSCTGTCFDIGHTTSAAIEQFERSGEPIAGATDPNSAGNGSLMRLAPAALHGLANGGGSEAARRQSATTHGAAACLDACEHFTGLLIMAMNGESRDAVLAPQAVEAEPAIAAILAGSWRGKARQEIRSSGYVAHSLEAALWAIGETGSFRDAVLLAANLGDDADTTAAVTGQLAGALYGQSGIPAEWLDKLAWRERIEALGRALLEPRASRSAPAPA
ncbi:MAG TPA: ADP-ribosylglycohydrolase family protein [Allosphingosinicella sp.]|nr:ADP-ribosylglycohydrolase family protein [Allosphingosinicella sp.]